MSDTDYEPLERFQCNVAANANLRIAYKAFAEIDKDGRLVMHLDSMSIDTQSKKVYNYHQPYGDLKDLDINDNQVSLTIKFPPTNLHPEGMEQKISFFTDDIEWLNDLNNEYAKAE